MKKDRISKYLSWLLRHCQKPLYINLQGGWASVETILQVLQKRSQRFDRRTLESVVAEDEKGRYSFDPTGEFIRANQGHSIPGVIIDMEKPAPPEYLYHGTAEAFLPSIMEKGLLPMSRQFVHISPDYETAVRVGNRHGKNGGTAVLEFAAGDFVRDGHDLRISPNGIWQAKAVPPKYLGVRVIYCEKNLPEDISPTVSETKKTADNTIETDRYGIMCKYSMPVLKDKPLKGIILGVHGFSGSKESTGLHVLAKRAVPEGYGLVSFDLPAHWKSPASPRMLTVENAMRDILFMAEECRREFPDLPRYIFATSFGAYLTLLCCRESGCQVKPLQRTDKEALERTDKEALERTDKETLERTDKGALADYHIILRAPAVTMPDVFLNLLNMTAEEFRSKAPCDCTNDPARPLPVYYSFYESLLRHSVFDAPQKDYPPMLVMHGEADEVVPPSDVRRFCEKYPQMDLHTISGCDHGFTAPGAHDEMCRLIMDYLEQARP